MEHIHGEERKPWPFERLLFLLGHKDTGSGSQEWAYKAAADGKGYRGREEKKTWNCGTQVIFCLTGEITFNSSNVPLSYNM